MCLLSACCGRAATVFAFVALVTLSATAHAAVINVPADQPTIQGAITASVAGDEIIVAPGVYNETINMMGKAVTLRSINPNNAGVITATIIDAGSGPSAGTVVTCNSGEGAATVILGLTITGVGGMDNVNSSPTVTNCTFAGNSGGGGGMTNSSSSPTVTNCIFTGNTAGMGGGMRNVNNSSPIVTNCIFTGNTATPNGGGMINDGINGPTVINCTFTGNTADSTGGGMFNSFGSPTVTNCILWGNTPNELEIDTVTGATTVVTFSNIPGAPPGTGNISLNPMFVDANGADNIFGTSDDDVRLLPGSPCIDAGNNAVVPVGIVTDLDGNNRFADDPAAVDTGAGLAPIVDMGAYEAASRLPPACPGDVNGSGTVDLPDLNEVLFNFGNTVTPGTSGDVDSNGVVNLDDLQLLLGNFGTSC